MAREVVVAVKDGDWSDPTTWNTGSLPDSTDQVFANGFTVEIDQDIEVRSIGNNSIPLSECPLMLDYTETLFDNQQGEVLKGGAYEQNGAEYNYPNNISLNIFDDDIEGRNFDFSLNGTNVYLTLPDYNFVGYDFKEPVKINCFYFYNGSRRLNAYKVQAWDGSTWIDLKTVSGLNTENVWIFEKFDNDTAYTKYRLLVTESENNVMYFYNSFRMFYMQRESFPAANGTFVITSDGTFSLTANDPRYGFYKNRDGNSASAISYTGNGTLNMYGNFMNNQNNPDYLYVSGNSNINVQGTILQMSEQSDSSTGFSIRCVGQNNLTIVGDIINNGGNRDIIYMLNGTLNITGDITSNYSRRFEDGLVKLQGAVTCNITGDIITKEKNLEINRAGGSLLRLYDSEAYCYHTGKLEHNYEYPYVVINGANSHSANIYDIPVYNVSGYYNQVGPMISNSFRGVCLYSPYVSGRNILTGPFKSSKYGTNPLVAARLYIAQQSISYEFRTSELNASHAPIGQDEYESYPSSYTMYTPDVLSDSPPESDVRLGVEYANQSRTGTLSVPLPSQVSLGIAVDDTTGTAVLNASDVWSEQVSNITTAGSIGERLKNASTVESTGDQLESFL